MNGCDSIVTLQLLVKYPEVAYTYASICEGDTYTFNGKTYYVDSHESAGSYNGLKRYNLRAHRFDNAPAAAST